jgi:hypothetical protein
MSHKGFLEYLELHGYFAEKGSPKLTQDEYAALDTEWSDLAARHARLSPDEKQRLAELKALLFRDRP